MNKNITDTKARAHVARESSTAKPASCPQEQAVPRGSFRGKESLPSGTFCGEETLPQVAVFAPTETGH
jgi:hypothetical protein